MPEVRTRIIPEPGQGARTVLFPTVLPVFRGGGDSSIRCGSCNALLAEHIDSGQIVNIVIKCPDCSAFGEV